MLTIDLFNIDFEALQVNHNFYSENILYVQNI